MYIRYIVFTKYIRFIYLLETMDMSVVQKLQCTLWTKYSFCFASIAALKLTKDCLERSSVVFYQMPKQDQKIYVIQKHKNFGSEYFFLLAHRENTCIGYFVYTALL